MSSNGSGPRQIPAVAGRSAAPTSRGAHASGRGLVAALTLGLLLACALVTALAWQLRGLRQERRELVERINAPFVGMYVPQVALPALDGQPLVLGRPRAQRQLLYFFSPTCPHCRASLPMLKTLAAQLPAASRGGAELIGVASADAAAAQAYAREHGLTFPIAATTEVRTAMLFRAHSVPLLLVIDADGRVRYSRIGVIDEAADLRAVLAALTPAGPELTRPKRTGPERTGPERTEARPDQGAPAQSIAGASAPVANKEPP